MKRLLSLAIPALVCSIYACNAPEKQTSTTEMLADSVEATIDSAAKVVEAAMAYEVADVPLTKWNYSATLNKMTLDSNYYATISANEELQFDFPYDGGVTATLMVRRKEKTTNVLLMVSKGQFNSSIDGQTIRVKFDDDKPALYSCAESSDNDPSVLFIMNASRFVSKLKGANTVLVEAEFYNAGVKQMEFDTRGFVWDHK